MVEQIYYSRYGSQRLEHEKYFEIIALIADWISVRLASESNGLIQILQVKEKFGAVSVYCNLAPETEYNIDYPRTDEMYIIAAKIYRQVYFEAKILWPNYWYAISLSADYPHFLYLKEEDFINSEEFVYSYRQGLIPQIYKVCNFKRLNLKEV